MGKMCHERFRRDMGAYLKYEQWCGKKSMSELVRREEGKLQNTTEKELPPLSTEELRNPDIHCKKCLKAKQAWKGIEYMRSSNFPVFLKGKWTV